MKLRQEVFNEALLLNQHTTQEEKDMLDGLKVNSRSSTNCIYGLMTGDCNSERAKVLIKLCVPDVKNSRLADCAVLGSAFSYEGMCDINYTNGTPIEIQIDVDTSTIPTIIGVIKGDITNNN